MAVAALKFAVIQPDIDTQQTVITHIRNDTIKHGKHGVPACPQINTVMKSIFPGKGMQPVTKA